MSDTKADGSKTESSGKPEQDDAPPPPPTALVWGTRLLSLGLLAAIVGYLLYLVLLRPPVPARFEVSLDFEAAEQRAGMWVLPVEVLNDSTNAVSEVVVELSQAASDGRLTRTSTFALMGEGERAVMEVRFPVRPDPSNTTAQVVAYQNP